MKQLNYALNCVGKSWKQQMFELNQMVQALKSTGTDLHLNVI